MDHMDQSGRNGLNCTKVDQIGPKCYIDVTQKEHSNNKCYTSVFRYYIYY